MVIVGVFILLIAGMLAVRPSSVLVETYLLKPGYFEETLLAQGKVLSNDLQSLVIDLSSENATYLNINGEAKILNWSGDGVLRARISELKKIDENKSEAKLSFEKNPIEIKNKFDESHQLEVQFFLSSEQNVLSIPLSSVVKNGNKSTVYVYQEGIAHLKEIRISKKNDKSAMVTSGLEEGDRVILFPGDRIREGTRVK